MSGMNLFLCTVEHCEFYCIACKHTGLTRILHDARSNDSTFRLYRDEIRNMRAMGQSRIYGSAMGALELPPGD